MGLLYNPENVVVGQAAGYFGLPNTAPPAHNVPLFGDWGPGWAAAGATNEGWSLNGDQSTTQHRIEEQANAVRNTLDQRTFGVNAALAEDTLKNVRTSFGGGTITTSVEGGKLITRFTLADDIEEFSVGLDMATVGGKIRRIVIPRATTGASVSVGFRRTADKRLWPVQFVATCASDEIEIYEIEVAPPAWTATTAYDVGDMVTLTGTPTPILVATVAGASGNAAPAAPAAGATVVDGTVTWMRL